MDVFLQVIQTTVNVCKRQHREKYFEDRSERRRSITAFANAVHIHIINPLSQIEAVAFNTTLNADERVRHIQVILSGENSQRQEVEEKTNEKDEERRQDLVATIRRGSVVAWQHINLLGEYDFSDEKLEDSVGLEVPKIRALTIA